MPDEEAQLVARYSTPVQGHVAQALATQISFRRHAVPWSHRNYEDLVLPHP